MSQNGSSLHFPSQIYTSANSNSDFKQRLPWQPLVAVPYMGRGYVTPKGVARPHLMYPIYHPQVFEQLPYFFITHVKLPP